MCRTPEIVVDGSHIWCVNCDRGASECPTCKTLRCNSDTFFSIMGHIPLACKVCQPNGIDTWMGPVDDEPGTMSIGWVPKGQPKPWETGT